MRASLCRGWGVLVGGVLVISIAPSVAIARPIVSMRAKAVHLPRASHAKGSRIGAAVEASYTIRGTEVGGLLPSPLEVVNLSLPRGTVLHSRGFPVCPATRRGAHACPRKSRAGGVGSLESVAPLGANLIPEPATLQAFFAPGGGLEFWTVGSRPLKLRLILATGHFERQDPSFGPTLTTALTPIATVPGGPDASVRAIALKLGATHKGKGGGIVSYINLPKRCPRPGYSVASELTFQNGERATVAASPFVPSIVRLHHRKLGQRHDPRQIRQRHGLCRRGRRCRLRRWPRRLPLRGSRQRRAVRRTAGRQAARRSRPGPARRRARRR